MGSGVQSKVPVASLPLEPPPCKRVQIIKDALIPGDAAVPGTQMPPK